MRRPRRRTRPAGRRRSRTFESCHSRSSGRLQRSPRSVSSRWISALAFSTLLLTPRGYSQPTDAHPAASVAGTWRVIEARAAPWVKPHRLEKHEAPLLEYALIFANDEVEGPAPLGCQHAKFATTVVEPKGLFQGSLPAGREEQIAKAMNLRPPSIATVRVDCDTGTFDYHFDDDGNLQTALNDVVYTLERPEPMDASKVNPGYSGPSFDCLLAR